MSTIQWLLDGLSRCLVTWGVALSRDESGRVLAPAKVPNEPFDAKQHWLDRVAQLPPQAWQQSGRAAQPQTRSPAIAAVSQRDLPRNVLALRRASVPDGVAARVTSHWPDAVFEVPRRPVMRHQPAATGMTDAQGVAIPVPDAVRTRDDQIAPTARCAAPNYTKSIAQFALPVPLSMDAIAPHSNSQWRNSPQRREANVLPTLTAPLSLSPWLFPLSASAASVDRHDESRAVAISCRESTIRRSQGPDHDVARHSPFIVEFDEKRIHTLEFAPPAMAQTAPPAPALLTPRSAASPDQIRVDRNVAADSNPLVRGWPDLPPWPVPRQASAHVIDRQARERHRRLELEQRG